MFCGDQHCACIVPGGQGGQALTWGCGLHGQLGHFSTSNEFFPRKVEHLRDIDVASVACGHRHTMFLTGDGEVYSCGEGVDGKLYTPGDWQELSRIISELLANESERTRISLSARQRAIEMCSIENAIEPLFRRLGGSQSERTTLAQIKSKA